MKPKVLLIYMDQSAKLGILPYLTSVFHPYLEFDSQLFDQIDPDRLSEYQMILFSSALCQTMVKDSVSHLGIPLYQCRRELNYTYLHRILEIPAGSEVCIVNDRKKNCEAIESSLLSLGFTQYQYCIYYPGAPSVNSSVQYAVTPGEARFAPPGIPYVVDIGNRSVDIGTLCRIITVFNLPETLLNQVTGYFTGYISNFMRYITQRLGQITARSYDNGKLVDYLDTGICITDQDGRILQTNPAFRNLLCMDGSILSGRRLADVFKEWNLFLEMDQITAGEPVLIQNARNELVEFYFSRKYRSAAKDRRYLFFAAARREHPGKAQTPLPEWRASPDTIQKDAFVYRLAKKSPGLSRLMELARAYAEREEPVLILGGPGLFEISAGRFLHSHSRESKNPFLYLDAAAAGPSAGSGSEGQSGPSPFFSPAALQKLLEENDGGTVFIDNLDRSDTGFQNLLSALLREQEPQNQPVHPKSRRAPRIICAAGRRLLEEISSGQFRPELFYRLSSLILKFPYISELKSEIPAFLSFYLEAAFAGTEKQPEVIFSSRLLDFLKEYEYPGNFQEMENLCRYFSCIYRGSPLSLHQLPPYIQYRPAESLKPLTEQKREVLSLIRSHPHCGRNRIAVLLSEKGCALSAHQIRSILAELSDCGYLEILKTKQGCRITELGEYALKNEPKQAERS